jgi:hypothetical protein
MVRSLPTLHAARIFVALIALVVAPWHASEVRAQERTDLPQIDFATAVALSATPVRLTELDQRQFPVAPVEPLRRVNSTFALKSLYASTAIMQGLDFHSTMAVLKRGGGEGNPLMAGVVSNKAAFLGIKAGVAAGSIMAARQIGKRNKVAAVATLLAINSAYAFVVQHNYKVARSLR